MRGEARELRPKFPVGRFEQADPLSSVDRQAE
jgi:hypothetical protein